MTTKTIPATQAKTQFAQLIDDARLAPVTITRNNRPVAIVLSPEKYELLERLDDGYWGEQAAAAEKEGAFSVEQSERLIEAILNEKD